MSLTHEDLAGFGPGDQFQIFYPEGGGVWIVGLIAQIGIGTTGQLQIRFDGPAVQQDRKRGGWAITDMWRHHYVMEGERLPDLAVSRREEGYLELLTAGIGAVLMFVKPCHQSYIGNLAAA